MTFKLKDENLRFALLKAISDAAADEMQRRRADHIKPLLERYDAEGTKSFAVKLPGGDLVATVSLNVPKDTLDVVDDEKFLDWLVANHPDAVDVVEVPAEPEHTVVVPARPARTERTPVAKKVTAVLNAIKTVDGKLVDTSTGVEVDGVVKTPGATPKSFAVKYEGEGRDLLAGAYRAGKLDSVVAGTTLPPIGATETLVERRLEPTPHITNWDEQREYGGVVPDAVLSEKAQMKVADGHAWSDGTHYPPTGAPHSFVDCLPGCPNIPFRVVPSAALVDDDGCPADCSGCAMCTAAPPEHDEADEAWRQAGMDQVDPDPDFGKDLDDEVVDVTAETLYVDAGDDDTPAGVDDEWGRWGAPSTATPAGW